MSKGVFKFKEIRLLKRNKNCKVYGIPNRIDFQSIGWDIKGVPKHLKWGLYGIYSKISRFEGLQLNKVSKIDIKESS